MESMGQGLLGLLLFMSNWLTPESGRAGLAADVVHRVNQKAAIVRCRLDIAWNPQMEKLVDAGIPLRFRIVSIIDRTDSISFYRTLSCNIVDYTYHYTDSVSGTTVTSREYPMILLALRDFCRWEIPVSGTVRTCRVEVQILPSRAHRLNRTVEMSRVWGQQRVVREISVQQRPSREKPKAKGG
jgi:hypothetical protein